MTELRIGDQVIRYDREATAAIYRTIERGGPERCGCLFCRNFIAQRQLVYPPSFTALLNTLGIEGNKEIEVFECGPMSDGCHFYGGWMYFVGEIVSWGEQTVSAPDAHEFAYFFTTVGPRAAAFRDAKLGIEFTAHVKWILPEGPDSGRRQAGERRET